jgi:hypothetical protein
LDLEVPLFRFLTGSASVEVAVVFQIGSCWVGLGSSVLRNGST